MIKVAITGNIASGKSIFENYLLEHGFKVFDTDTIAHEILENSQDVRDAFNMDRIDRKKLGEIVFQDKKKLKILENIIHPKVKEKILEIFENNQDEKYVFISVPQLFESGFDKFFDKIILVKAGEIVRLERLKKRNNLSEEEAQIRIKSQIPEDEKIKKSDYIINNNSTLDAYFKGIEEFMCNIKY